MMGELLQLYELFELRTVRSASDGSCQLDCQYLDPTENIFCGGIQLRLHLKSHNITCL